MPLKKIILFKNRCENCSEAKPIANAVKIALCKGRKIVILEKITK